MFVVLVLKVGFFIYLVALPILNRFGWRVIKKAYKASARRESPWWRCSHLRILISSLKHVLPWNVIMQLLNKRAKQQADNHPAVIWFLRFGFSNKVMFNINYRMQECFGMEGRSWLDCQTFCMKTIVYLKFSPGVGTEFGLSAARQSVLASQTLHCWAFIKPGKQKPFQHVLKRTCLIERSVFSWGFKIRARGKKF